jgi:hypothetical protein
MSRILTRSCIFYSLSSIYSVSGVHRGLGIYNVIWKISDHASGKYQSIELRVDVLGNVGIILTCANEDTYEARTSHRYGRRASHKKHSS